MPYLYIYISIDIFQFTMYVLEMSEAVALQMLWQMFGFLESGLMRSQPLALQERDCLLAAHVDTSRLCVKPRSLRDDISDADPVVTHAHRY